MVKFIVLFLFSTSRSAKMGCNAGLQKQAKSYQNKPIIYVAAEKSRVIRKREKQETIRNHSNIQDINQGPPKVGK